jgi:hypothetical protein
MSSDKAVSAFFENWAKENDNIFGDDFKSLSTFVKEFKEAIKIIDTKKMDELIKTLPKENKELQEYVNMLNSVQTSYTKTTDELVVDDLFINAISTGLTSDCLKKVDKPMGYQEVLLTMDELYANTDLFVFLISNKDSLSGEIVGKVKEKKIKVELASHYIPRHKDSEPFNLFFGQGAAKIRPVKSLSVEFYGYVFEDNNQQYLMLSCEPINSSRITARGMLVDVADKLVIGESHNLAVNTGVFFVYDFEEEKREFTEKEIRGLFGCPSYEEVLSMVFGKYRHPDWVQKLLLSWLFCYPIEGYPLHLMILGPPKTGKSKSIINPIYSIIPDERHNGESTFKGLIPSFGGGKGSKFNEGALLRADRVCYLDEFTTPVCTGSHNYNEISNVLGKMNGLLEWHVGKVSSGNGAGLDCVTPTMQILSCGNYQKGFDDVVMLASRLNNAALSRFMIYSQNRDNVDFIKRESAKIMGDQDEEKRLPKKTENMTKLYDFFKMKSNVAKIDYQWVARTVNKYAEVVVLDLKDVYVRYDHHLACIVDGISKLRWLTGEKESFFEVDKEDYEEAEDIFAMVVSSWVTSDEEIQRLPRKARVKHLGGSERELYEYISHYGGITKEDLEDKLSGYEPYLDKLIARGLVYTFFEKYYAYWHNVVKEQMKAEVKNGQNNISQWDNRDFED